MNSSREFAGRVFAFVDRTACYKTSMATPLKIGFLGAGKMATALAKGFVRAELVVPKEIIASDPHEAARKHFAAEVGAKTVVSNAEVVKFARIVILATKPDQAAAALAKSAARSPKIIS